MDETANYTGANLLFIVGSPRSGTTWLQRLLASHPQIRTGQESKLFVSYLAPQLQAWRYELSREQDAKRATGRGGSGLSCYFDEAEFMPILHDYMMQLLKPMIGDLKPGEIFLEKTPSHALYLTEIKALLPDARIIHVLRDARDVVASLLAASQSWGEGWAPNVPDKAASMWTRHVKAVRKSAKNFSAREFHEIKYENLSAAPEQSLRQVAEFLNLKWDAQEIANAVNTNCADAVKKSASSGTVIPLHGEAAKRTGEIVKEPGGFIRRAQPGGWKADLSLNAKLRVWRVARKTMREVGYSWR